MCVHRGVCVCVHAHIRAYGFFSLIIIFSLAVVIMSLMYFIYSRQPKKRNRKERSMVLLFRILTLNFTHFFHLYPIVQNLVIFSHLDAKSTGVGCSFSFGSHIPSYNFECNYWGQKRKRLRNNEQTACHTWLHVCYNNLEIR